MPILVNENTGIISMYQGDTGKLYFDNLPNDKEYVFYLSFYNSKRTPIVDEISVELNNSTEIEIELGVEITDKFTVPINKKYEIYFYGIKVCNVDDKTEDTLFVENNDFGDLNRIYVYPKQVEGIV